MGPAAKLLLSFALVLSLSSVPSINTSQNILFLPAAYTSTAPTEPWYPAGPAMDTLTYPIFNDEAAEFAAIQINPSPIDFTDWPLDPALIASLSGNPNFQVTSPISDTGYFELEFHMGQNWWGCQFNYGNAACGKNIRQAFAHGLDKNIFISTELGGNAQPIDNPVPPSVDLNTPDPCAWDALFPQTGAGCVVNGVGGTAYHLAAATAGNCASHPQFAYTPGCGTPDFCAAADHMIAAGLATGKSSTTCVLTGVSSAVTANPTHIFVRSDNTPRLHAGNSYGQFICALFTGTFSTGCSGIFVVDPGPITAFPGFTTSTTTVALAWWVYTAGFGNVSKQVFVEMGFDDIALFILDEIASAARIGGAEQFAVFGADAHGEDPNAASHGVLDDLLRRGELVVLSVAQQDDRRGVVGALRHRRGRRARRVATETP